MGYLYMKRTVKLDLSKRIRLSAGLLDVLRYDMEVMNSAVENYDFITVGEYIRDVNETMESLIDNLAEVEYMVYRTTTTLLKLGGEHNE